MLLPRALTALLALALGVVASAIASRAAESAAAPALSGTAPVNPNATPEARALLAYLREISGQRTLAGQHNPPLLGDTRLPTVHKQLGRYPAVFGQDFGFSPPGTWDGVNYRQRIVDDAIRRHHEGFVITLMWHAVRPTEDEPVEFETSIQGKLTDAEWRDLTTPGTALHARWLSQVDVIASFLKQLRYAKVPVLWRPYHEMNGGWFWWGKRRGDDGYRKLYRQLYERFVGFHRLDNLLWVYNANELREGVDPYAAQFPGADVVDVLATDVYRNNFAATDYESLLALAAGKPIALGEVGPVPTVETLRAQPRWTWFMCWNEPVRDGKDRDAVRAAFSAPEVLTWEELPWVKTTQPTVHAPVLK